MFTAGNSYKVGIFVYLGQGGLVKQRGGPPCSHTHNLGNTARSCVQNQLFAKCHMNLKCE